MRDEKVGGRRRAVGTRDRVMSHLLMVGERLSERGQHILEYHRVEGIAGQLEEERSHALEYVIATQEAGWNRCAEADVAVRRKRKRLLQNLRPPNDAHGESQME